MYRKKTLFNFSKFAKEVLNAARGVSLLESFTKIEAAFVEVPTKTAVIVNSFLSSLRIPRIKSSFESHWRMTYNRYSQNNIKFIVNEDLFCTFISTLSCHLLYYVIAKDD